MSLTTLFVAVLLPVLLALTGLVADGGQVLVARRQVQGLADSAAHAGAAELDSAGADSSLLPRHCLLINDDSSYLVRRPVLSDVPNLDPCAGRVRLYVAV